MELVAEIGQAHDGSLGILHSYIDNLSEIGIETIKFQMHIAEAESSIFEPFRVNFSYEDSSRYDYWKRMEFTPNQWKEIKAHCEEKRIEFFCTPFSLQAIDLLETLDVKRYKIGSADATNKLLLDKVASTEKDVILSTGMISFEQLDDAVEIFLKRNVDLTLMYCVSKYPSYMEDINFESMSDLKKRYGLKIGFSDHSGSIWPLITACSLGADVGEFHVVYDKKMFGPDSLASLTLSEISSLKEARDAISLFTQKNDKEEYEKHVNDLNAVFGRSLAINKDLKKDHILTLDDFESKKAGSEGVSSNDFSKFLGKKVKSDMKKWDLLKFDDIN